MSNVNDTQKESKEAEQNYPLMWYYNEFCENCWRRKTGNCNHEITRLCTLACIAVSLHDLVRELIRFSGELKATIRELKRNI